MIKAVQCHEFALVEQVKPEKQVQKHRIKYGKRLQPKKVRQVLSLDALPVPKLNKHDQVLIQTCYAGIQYPDFLQSQGLYQSEYKLR